MVKAELFSVVTDTHGDQQDDESVDALFQFMDKYKPTIRVHAGDAFDMRNLRNGASQKEKSESQQQDIDAGLSFLNRYFKGGKRNYFLRGNHDERLWEAAGELDGVYRDYANAQIKVIKGVLRKYSVKMLPYDAAKGVLKLGKLSIVHGYHAGANACKQHAAIYGNSIFGHVHTIESAPVPSLEPAEARSIGCLCKRDMDYINRKTGKLRWGHGWAYGVLFPDGSYHLEQARKIKGRFCVALNFETIRAA